jgi:hypothetical protein
MIGLFGYVGKAAKAFGLVSNPDIGTGVLVPLIAGGVWLGLRQMHKRIHAMPGEVVSHSPLRSGTSEKSAGTALIRSPHNPSLHGESA